MKTQNLFDDPKYQPTKPEPGPRAVSVNPKKMRTHAGYTVMACEVCEAKDGYLHPVMGFHVEITVRDGVGLCQRCLAVVEKRPFNPNNPNPKEAK